MLLSSSLSNIPPPRLSSPVAAHPGGKQGRAKEASRTMRQPGLMNLIMLISLASFGLLGGQKINLTSYVAYLQMFEKNAENYYYDPDDPTHTLPEIISPRTNQYHHDSTTSTSDSNDKDSDYDDDYDNEVPTHTLPETMPVRTNAIPSSSSSNGASSSTQHSNSSSSSSSSSSSISPAKQQQQQRNTKLSAISGIEWVQGHDPLRYQALPLEFVHIPKTGGTSIEAALANNGYSWGFCKFMDRPNSLSKSLGAVACPVGRPPMGQLQEYRQRFGPHQKALFQGAMPWHLPPWRFDRLPWFMDMYQNATLFTVVRNPYDRIISEYYFENFVYKLPAPPPQSGRSNRMPPPGTKLPLGVAAAFARVNANAATQPPPRPPPPRPQPSAAHLNAWAQKILLERRKFVNQSVPWNFPQQDFGLHGGHWIPQYDYCYHPATGDQIVQHILRFETLQEEFQELMQLYNLSDAIQLPHVMTSSGARDTTTTSPKATTTNSSATNTTATNSTTSTSLTREDLYDSTKQMIELLFAQDFDTFGYTRESVGNHTPQELWTMVFTNMNNKNKNNKNMNQTVIPAGKTTVTRPTIPGQGGRSVPLQEYIQDENIDPDDVAFKSSSSSSSLPAAAAASSKTITSTTITSSRQTSSQAEEEEGENDEEEEGDSNNSRIWRQRRRRRRRLELPSETNHGYHKY